MRLVFDNKDPVPLQHAGVDLIVRFEPANFHINPSTIGGGETEPTK
jgi:hypothetical protein